MTNPPSEVNANGASELASLMRVMKADLEAARVAIERGEPIAPMHPHHRKIRCAWPTGLEDRNPTFEASAITYLQLVRTLDSRPADLRAAYGGVVAGCLACHATCLQTVEHCLTKGGAHAAREHIQLLLDCAELCESSAHFMIRESPFQGRICALCAEACRACEEACRRMGDAADLRCAESCRRCAEMLPAVTWRAYE